MSYILDALRKADAQRERDPSRGIHAQPLTVGGDASAGGGSSRYGLWVVAGLAALALAVVGWQWASPAAPAAVPVAPVTAAPVVATPLPAPVAAAPAVAQAVSPAPAPVLPSTPPMPKVVAPAPAPAVAARAAPAVKPAASAPTVVAAPAAAASPAPALAEPAAQPAITPFAQLPPDVKNELAKLVVTGGVYSDNPGQRMLIVNGQVLGEGAEAAPGVVLEQIRPRIAVLRYRSFRYSVTY